jgi:hypothetical protein
MSSLAFIKQTLTHAEERNARFNTNTSVFVSAKQRFDDYCAFVPGSANQMQNAIKDFKKRHAIYSVWGNTVPLLVDAKTCKLKDILIDDTMNRPLNWKHVITILENFNPTRIMAVNVYEDPDAPGHFVAWDGQHTTLVLYVIAVLICGKNINDIEIPINISKATRKDEIRENFIEINGKAKLSLNPLELFEQEIFGVNVDGSNRTDWKISFRKFEALRDAKLFLTSTDYRDSDKDGAITHVASIINNSPEVVEDFANYWKTRSALENRRVESKELVHMIYLFNYARTNDINWSEEDISQIVDIFWNCFECEFSGTAYNNPFWSALANSYEIWYDKIYSKVAIEYRPTFFKMRNGGPWQETFGLKFMLSQLESSGFSGQLPKYEHPAGYKPRPADLWEYSIDTES